MKEAEQSRAELQPRAWAWAWAWALCGRGSGAGVGVGVVLLSFLSSEDREVSVSVSGVCHRHRHRHPHPHPHPNDPSGFTPAPSHRWLASVLVAKSISETDRCVATGMPRPTVVQQSDFTGSPGPLAPWLVCRATPNGRQKSQNVRRRVLALPYLTGAPEGSA